MNARSLALTLLTLLLSMLLSTGVHKSQAAARPVPEPHPSSPPSSSFQVLGVSKSGKLNHKKQVDSSFRRIPPSTSNPIQNKSNPPLQGERSRRQQLPRSLKH
ncbi:hypothetical protein ERO13_A09G075900v2 [Gossypium hirsutum]|uniref:Uncharacterized protein n=4 Tax=Gossypium TaxID=3633 RepID=A0A2P5Y2G8_GOSBA|nr:uncharacterized protein LOC107890268 [Gossypium hirsutum]KAB2065268.1 hypothetical protein ES319_A09G079400v1 [Gossypium barbadense]TYH01910.1 hypothetical protein ES288_A09G098000v1 [Gossypium darwinii]TYI09722.1 hypothetical protein ES332_A09G093400v1 [Gossypium tomentosum]KAG4182912.1 hypothetical protein ERO13_A09G075900v2 [Gossypium hirsutum]PPS09800.1 hypothetical protein GOBAR_AA10852 [Gossypium barbadense]